MRMLMHLPATTYEGKFILRIYPRSAVRWKYLKGVGEIQDDFSSQHHGFYHQADLPSLRLNLVF